MKPILLLVDMQRDYLSAAGLEPAAGVVVERAATLLEACRQSGVPVVHAWTSVRRDKDERMTHWKRAGRWLCVEGTEGHAPPEDLRPLPGEAVVHKTGFNAFAGGALDAEFTRSGADTVLICGVHLHACVRQAALEAYERGLRVWVAEDATASDDPVHGATSRRYLEARSVRFGRVDELLEALRAGETGPPPESPVAEAVERARSAAPAWRSEGRHLKAALFEDLANRLEARAGDLAAQMAAELGKPVRYGRVEVERTADMLRTLVRRAESQEDESGPPGTVVRRRPHGVAAVVTPWNNPVYIALGKIVPALLYDNTVVWKPAPEAVAVSRQVMALLHEAGCPPGAVEMVAGGRREAERLMADPGVDLVSLTGSSLAGRSAQEICARRRIPLQAEMGGNNAALVWPDADLERAARQIADGAFAMAGQRCTANRRVVVHQSCRAELVRLLAEATAALHWGDPSLPTTQVGPLVSAASRDRVARLVARAERATGPGLTPHGTAVPASASDGRFAGAWYPPTLLFCEDPSLEIVQEETFGPVLVVQTARDWEHAIQLCNGVKQGLAAAVFTGSRDMAGRFLEQAQAGLVKVNQSTADAVVDAPFGGWKASGIGPPEHGRFDLEFFSRPQTVYGDVDLLTHIP